MKKALRWTSYLIGGVLGVGVLALAIVYGATEYQMSRHYEVPAVALNLRQDPATIARGKHIATIRGCTDCHGGNLAGTQFLDVPMLGRVYASNLTRGENGAAQRFSDSDWDRAIRHGVKPDGTPLLVMPSQDFQGLSDADLAAVVAYLKSVPAVNTSAPENELGPLGRFLEITGKAALLPARRIAHRAPRAPAPPEGPTREYGAYLATACSGCHGEHFSGGPVPGMPPGTPEALNLTTDSITGIGRWSEADFARALRQGKKPDGSQLRAPMPVWITAQLTDDELHAVWLYLSTLPPRPFRG